MVVKWYLLNERVFDDTTIAWRVPYIFYDKSFKLWREDAEFVRNIKQFKPAGKKLGKQVWRKKD